MRSELDLLALNLVRGAFCELYLTPKPGLVDLVDSGSHPDLSLSKMESSIRIVSRYLSDLSDSLQRGEDLSQQVRLGAGAEREMLDTLGSNCHKGYIFLSGLLLAAGARLERREEKALREEIALLASRLFAAPDSLDTNGSRVRRTFQAAGIRGEALLGFPSLFEEALPVYREELSRGGNRGSALYAMLGRLMATVEDTTALHRCGSEGLRTLQEDGRELERLVSQRLDFLGFLAERNDHYVRHNLTMGGVADLLALACGWLSHTGELRLAP